MNGLCLGVKSKTAACSACLGSSPADVLLIVASTRSIDRFSGTCAVMNPFEMIAGFLEYVVIDAQLVPLSVLQCAVYVIKYFTAASSVVFAMFSTVMCT